MPINFVRRHLTRSLALSFSLACLAFSSSSNQSSARQNVPVDPDLTAHEWGTFTSIVDRTLSHRRAQDPPARHCSHGDACHLLLFPP